MSDIKGYTCLISEPLNQVRPYRLLSNGTLSAPANLQSGFQCLGGANGTTVIEGDCPVTGGTGYGCPCPDIRRSDPRIAKIFPPEYWPPIDPRQVGAFVLRLSETTGTTGGGSAAGGGAGNNTSFSGEAVVVGNNNNVRLCSSTLEHPLYVDWDKNDVGLLSRSISLAVYACKESYIGMLHVPHSLYYYSLSLSLSLYENTQVRPLPATQARS